MWHDEVMNGTWPKKGLTFHAKMERIMQIFSLTLHLDKLLILYSGII